MCARTWTRTGTHRRPGCLGNMNLYLLICAGAVASPVLPWLAGIKVKLRTQDIFQQCTALFIVNVKWASGGVKWQPRGGGGGGGGGHGSSCNCIKMQLQLPLMLSQALRLERLSSSTCRLLSVILCIESLWHVGGPGQSS